MCGKILHTLQFGIIMCIKKVFASVHKQINKSGSMNNYLPGSNQKYGNNLQVQKNTVLRMLAPRLAGPNRMLQGSQIPVTTINNKKYICVSMSGSRPPTSMPGPGGRGLSGASAALLPVRRGKKSIQPPCTWRRGSELILNHAPAMASPCRSSGKWRRRVEQGGRPNGRKWISNIHLDLENLQEAPFLRFCPSICTQNN
jgi:hypothetical protein